MRGGRRLCIISSQQGLLELWPEYPDSFRRSIDAVGQFRPFRIATPQGWPRRSSTGYRGNQTGVKR
jgi:hypothetical protein